METKQTKGMSGLYGMGQIRLTKTKVLVKMDPDSGGESYEIDRENAPEDVEAGHFNIALSAAGDKMFSYRPIAGTFTAKFVKFAAPKDSAPAPVLEESKYKDANGNVKIGAPQQVFTAIILAGGQYEYPVKLPYRFDEDDSGNTFIPYRKMGKRLEQLLNFLDVTGVKEKAVPYTENILPVLEEMIEDEDRAFLITVERGWVTSFNPPLSQPKKAKAKAKKK
jgi:hypothetical protein